MCAADARSTGVSVGVAGGGIGGLSAALALLPAGFDVHVFERASQLGEVGAGVQISPNASRILHRFGLAEQLARTGGEAAGVAPAPLGRRSHASRAVDRRPRRHPVRNYDHARVRGGRVHPGRAARGRRLPVGCSRWSRSAAEWRSSPNSGSPRPAPTSRSRRCRCTGAPSPPAGAGAGGRPRSPRSSTRCAPQPVACRRRPHPDDQRDCCTNSASRLTSSC
jgi:FAD binding domain-containing protein